MFGKLRLLSHYAVHCIIVSVGILTFNFLSLPSVLGLLHISNSTSSTSDRRVPRPFACSLEVFLFCKFENAGNKRIEIRMPLQFRLKPPPGGQNKKVTAERKGTQAISFFSSSSFREGQKSPTSKSGGLESGEMQQRQLSALWRRRLAWNSPAEKGTGRG